MASERDMPLLEYPEDTGQLVNGSDPKVPQARAPPRFFNDSVGVLEHYAQVNPIVTAATERIWHLNAFERKHVWRGILVSQNTPAKDLQERVHEMLSADTLVRIRITTYRFIDPTYALLEPLCECRRLARIELSFCGFTTEIFRRFVDLLVRRPNIQSLGLHTISFLPSESDGAPFRENWLRFYGYLENTRTLRKLVLERLLTSKKEEYMGLTAAVKRNRSIRHLEIVQDFSPKSLESVFAAAAVQNTCLRYVRIQSILTRDVADYLAENRSIREVELSGTEPHVIEAIQRYVHKAIGSSPVRIIRLKRGAIRIGKQPEIVHQLAERYRTYYRRLINCNTIMVAHRRPESETTLNVLPPEIIRLIIRSVFEDTLPPLWIHSEPA